MPYRTYHYTGPHYYNGIKMSEYNNLYTSARSFKEARNNFIYRFAAGDIPSRYDIVDSCIEIIVKETPREYKYCNNCGNRLSDGGYCPLCDDGDESILETMKRLNEIV